MSNKTEEKTTKPAARSPLKPRLRFPEFRDAGEWEKRELHEFVTIINEKAGRNKFTLFSISAGIGLVSQIEKFGREIAGAQYKNYFVIRKNEFAYNKSATKEYPEGYIAMYSGEDPAAVPNSIFTGFRVDDDNVSPLYLNYLFFGNLHGKWLRTYITVGARAHGSLNIDNKYLLSLPVPLPQGESSLNEQQKIAKCFSSIDELITAEAQKLDTIKTHKKGLMQQLFPVEGETTPKLRFPEFQDAGEWKKQKVSGLLKRVSNPVNVDLDEMYQQIGIRSHGKGIFHKEPVSGKELGNKRVFWVEEDAFVVNIVFAWEQAIANTSITEKGMIASHRFPMYKARGNKSDVNYVKYFFLTKKGKYLLGLASPGGAGRNKTLGQKEFENLEFLLPEKVEEQTKIAECLTSIDELINAQTKKLATLKAHKKGLMQQLFPALDEVHG